MASLNAAMLEHGIRTRTCMPGATSKVPCPRAGACGSRSPKDNDLSVTIDQDGGGATWQCHRGTCGGWSGGVRVRDEPSGFHGRPTHRVYRRPEPPAEQPRTDALFEFFAKRGIPREVVERNKIYITTHWFPKSGKEERCVAFPFHVGGEVVNIKYRSARKEFMQEKDAEKVFYGMDDCDGYDWCIIVEGEMDKLALEVAGYTNVLSVPDGAPAKLKDGEIDPENDKKFEYVWNCKSMLDRMQKVILAVDNDGPGQVLEEELARRIGREKIFRVHWPALANDVEVKDANDSLMQGGIGAVQAAIEGAIPYPIANLYEVEDYADKVLALFRGEADMGLDTGFPNLDEHMRLNGSGLLVIVTGIPGHGKSEFIDQIAFNYGARHGWVTGFCSFENPPERHIPKWAEKYTGKSFFQFRDTIEPRMTERELRDALGWINRRALFIRAEDESPTIDWILGKAKVAVMRYGMKMLVIDPYNEVEHKRPPNQTETEYVSEMLAKLKRFGQLHGVDIVFVAHPKKLEKMMDGSEPVPTLYDISGAAHFNNKADFGVVVWRDRNITNGNTSVHIRKVKWKHLGKEGIAEFCYNRDNGIYTPAT